MPYANEHAARVADPGDFKRVRDITDAMRKKGWDIPDGVRLLGGPTKDGGFGPQAWRFDADEWDADEAKKWLKKNKHRVMGFEEATGDDEGENKDENKDEGEGEDVGASFCYVSRGLRPSVALSAAKQSGGVPRQRFRKELIRDGQYVKTSDGISFRVTPRLREHWRDTFLSMRRNGVRVSVPAGHRGASDPKRNFGWVVDMENEGESLYGIMDLIGEDALVAAARNDVSVYSPRQWTDGKGNRYTRPITHVALCPDPVIPGLGDFEAIAASFEPRDDGKGARPMDWTKIREALHIDDDVTDANAEELILSAVAAAEQRARELIGDNDDDSSAECDPELLRLSRESRTMKLDDLVRGGRITSAVRKRLAKRYLDEGALSFSLARKEPDGFDDIVDILKDNDPVVIAKERTGPQVLRLSREQDDEDNPIAADVLRRRKAAGLKD